MFTGSYVALITPFRDGRVDEDALRALVEFQIGRGTNGIVPCGTTGEAATLSSDEWVLVVRTVVEQVGGRVPVVAGTGGNDTARTIARTCLARELGADGALVVAPYYNKPTQEGLYQHFSTVARQGRLPVILYNVPGRTGVNVLPETVVRLADEPNIVAVKEASGSLDQVSQIVLEAGSRLAVFSGDDALALPAVSIGAMGVVSVVANVAPEPVARMIASARGGDLATAARLHQELFPLARALFLESNPIPVKAAAAWLGLCADELRLPLTSLSDANRARLESVLRDCPWTQPPALGNDWDRRLGCDDRTARVAGAAVAAMVGAGTEQEQVR
jgi:4-hydroxy-tetrahydrodipicolinate synthase